MTEEKKITFYVTFKLIIRIAIGAFFIVSAILKLLSLETFELYIYSFKLFGFTLSTLVARLVIACELLSGALIISKIHYRKAWWLAMLMLIGFTLLLVYVVIFRDDKNCHCMGDIVQLKPSLSIIKNIVTMGLLLLIRNEIDYNFKAKTAVLTAIIAASIIPPFVLFPTDNVYNLIFKKREYMVDEATFNGFLADSIMKNVNLENGNYLVGVLSSGCEFCKVSALKISEMVENNGLDSSRVVFFIWGGVQSVADFKEETKTIGYNYVAIDPIVAVRMVQGSFPTYLFLKDGEIEKTADIRQLTENEITGHLK